MTNYGTVGSHINAEDGNDTIINYGTVGAGINGQGDKDTITNYGTAGSIVAFTGDDIINSLVYINNAQVTASQDTTFTALVSGASDKRVPVIAALFEDNADTATGDLADVMEKLNFMTQAQMESVFRQMTGLDGTTRAMTRGIRMGSGAAMARMGSMLASRGTSNACTGIASLPAISPTHEKQAHSLETMHFMKRVSAMIYGDNTSLSDRADAIGLSSPDLCATHLASLNIALPSAGELGPSLDLGSSDTGGVWLRALGSLSHQEDKGTSYGYRRQNIRFCRRY